MIFSKRNKLAEQYQQWRLNSKFNIKDCPESIITYLDSIGYLKDNPMAHQAVLADVLAEFQKHGHTSPEKFEMTWDTLEKILSKYFS